jgi:hypothetical protein
LFIGRIVPSGNDCPAMEGCARQKSTGFSDTTGMGVPAFDDQG